MQKKLCVISFCVSVVLICAFAFHIVLDLRSGEKLREEIKAETEEEK